MKHWESNPKREIHSIAGLSQKNEKMSVYVLCLFSNWIGGFHLLNFHSSLHILGNSLLLDMQFANIFSNIVT